MSAVRILHDAALTVAWAVLVAVNIRYGHAWWATWCSFWCGVRIQMLLGGSPK